MAFREENPYQEPTVSLAKLMLTLASSELFLEDCNVEKDVEQKIIAVAVNRRWRS